MDKGGSLAQQHILVHYAVGPLNRNRCFHQGVGCLLPGDDHRGSLDCCKVTVSYQLSEHINFLALKSFLRDKRINVLLRMDNVTPIAFVNMMGGTHSTALSDLAMSLWEWCLEREITIHAEHVHGTLNVRADWESHHIIDSSDWILWKAVLLQLEQVWGPFSIDLFASRTNPKHQLIAAGTDRAAQTVDALSIPWRDHFAYMFPPFSLIMRCLEKICLEQATAVLVAPVWQNQLWYPLSAQEHSRISLPPSTNSGHPSEPRRSDASISDESGPPPSSHMACLRRTFHSEGLSDGVIELICKSWWNSTESACSSAWRMWDSWCIDPLSTSKRNP